MTGKRPHDESENGPRNANKRPRSNEPSPAPTNGVNGANPGATSIQDQIAAAKARAAAVKERLNAGAKPPAAQSAQPTTGQSPADAARAKIEAMKARVAAATSRSTVPTSTPPPPPSQQEQQHQQQPRTNTSYQQAQEQEDGQYRARGGLGVGLHPSLLGESNQNSRTKKGPIGSRFSTTMGNRKHESPGAPTSSLKTNKQLDLTGPSPDELKQNPYFDPNVSAGAVAPRGRKSRELLFHQKGKFIAQAAALRRQAQLEEMKRRIAESARKAGLDDDRSEQSFLIPEPPGLEWWDEGLIEGTVYPDFKDDAMEAEKHLKIDTDDSVVTRYIQHPVLLDPPQEKNMPPPKAMFMTKREQAKKRRQDRTEVRKEQQAKVRLGLEPPEPPKVKKSNLMRVLGEQAVKDPTAVEARVNREIADRKEKHEQANEERMLSKDERREKLAANQDKDASKGILVNVYRIDSLAYGKHRYQIDVNAKQHALTGMTIMNPKLNLVIVEGGAWSIAKYKKLMLQRIRWTENAPPTEAAQETQGRHHKEIAEASFLQPEDDKGELKDLGDNRCLLIWEGEERQRAFGKWGSRVCETDADARRALEKFKMENMWQLAKNWTSS